MNTFAKVLKKTTIQSDIRTIELRNKLVGELMYEGQGHKLSTFKMKKKGFFTNLNTFLRSVAEDGKKKKTKMVI